jgi:hypothetical protein
MKFKLRMATKLALHRGTQLLEMTLELAICR